MIRYSLSLLLLTLSAFLFAQTEDLEINYNLYLSKDSAYYIYADVANVRAGASLDSERIDQLVCGDEITVADEDDDNEDTINHLKSTWRKIKYLKDNETKEGYIWLPNLSRTQLRRGNVKFVFGVDDLKSKGEYHEYAGQLKAVKDGKIVSRTNFDTELIPLIGASMIDNTGLIDIEKAIKISFSGEACGIPSIDQYFVWNGTELKYLTNTYSVGDGGIYNHNEILIFPSSHGGYANTIIKYISEFQADEDSNGDYLDDGKYQYKTEIYTWDGNKLILQDQKWK